MYATCLFCDAPFGRNEALEAMPVGRRLAFDSERGRLWVVCGRCSRWNLTPLDERWEAIEDAERRFRGTRLRVTTDNIGMARLPDGTDLVRIGRPLRPEFAAWRYGDQFGRRRRRALAAGGVGAVAAAAAAPVVVPAVAGVMWSFGGAALSGYVAGGAQLPYQYAKAWLLSERVIARVPLGVAGPLGAPTAAVRVRHLRESALTSRGGAPALRLAHDGGVAELAGDAAQRALGTLLARSNAWGAPAPAVREAVRRIDARGDAAGWLRAAARLSTRPGGRVMAKLRRVGAFGLTPVERLAVEMALHEEQERRVLEGELASLADAWRDAEEVAAIADGL